MGIRTMMLLLFSLLCMCAFHACSAEFITRYEFEDVVGGAGHLRSPWRSEASGLSALHAYNGDKIVLEMCLREPTQVTVEHIVYSNDGHGDVIEVNINEHVNTSMFKYTKPTAGGWGHHWNSFFSSQRIGKVVNLTSGRHTLSFLVYAADCYGVEFDLVLIRSNKEIEPKSFWCGADFLESKLPFFPICGRPYKGETLNFTTRVNVFLVTPIRQRPFRTTTTPSSGPMSSKSLPSISISSTSSTKEPTTSPIPTSAMATSPRAVRGFIDQLSFRSTCFDDRNVKIRFNPLTLTKVQIKVRSGNKRRKGFKYDNDEHISEETECRKTFWQVGKIDNSNSDLGPITKQREIYYDIRKESETSFPGTIIPRRNQKIVIKYTVSRGKDIKGGVAYFTVGLVNVVTEIKIGMQYVSASGTNTSPIHYMNFKPESTIIGWDLPYESIAPNVENQIHLFFDVSSAQRVRIDFIRLDHTDHGTTFTQSSLANVPSWIINGYEYNAASGQGMPKGMEVFVDGNLEGRKFAKIVITSKPIFKVLTIKKEGLIFPHHETRGVKKKVLDYGGDKFSDVSAVRFGNPDKQFSTVDINTKSSLVTLTYEDESFVRLRFEYSYVRTKIDIVKHNLVPPSITFLSTKISENIAAVNKVSVKGYNDRDVFDKNLAVSTATMFGFKKLTQNLMYTSSYELLIKFPKNSIPIYNG